MSPTFPRSYTVQEIDALREAMKNRLFFGNANGETKKIHSYESRWELDQQRYLESRLRTYMLAGITAEDLKRADLAAYEAAEPILHP